MDIATIVTILGSTFAIIFSMLGCFLWVRSEANNDRNALSNVQREDRKDLLQISRNLEMIMKEMQQENKDFHTRLCVIEQSRGK
jgi:predicted membrane protein